METEMAAGIKYGLCSILFCDPTGPCIEKGCSILRMSVAFNKKHTLTGFKTLPTCPRGVHSKFRHATDGTVPAFATKPEQTWQGTA